MNEKLGTKIKEDGIFGRETLATMKKLQEFLTIPVTGVYDQVTRDALFKICTEYKQEQYKQPREQADRNEPKEVTGKLLDKNITDMTIILTGTLFMSFTRGTDFFTKGDHH